MGELSRKTQQVRRSAGLGVLAAVVAALLSQTAPWRDLEVRFQGRALAARPPPWSPDVVLLGFDDAYLQRMSFPLPRAQMARLVRALGAAGVRAVGLDVLLTQEGIDGAPGTDALARAIDESGNVVLGSTCLAADPLHRATVSLEAASGLLPRGRTPGFSCDGYRPPTAALLQSGTLAQLLLSRGGSGQFVGVFAFVDVQQWRVPTLALAMATAGEHQPIVQRAAAVELGGARVPVNDDGSVRVSFRTPSHGATASVADLLDAMGSSDPPRFTPELERWLRGKYALLAVTATSLQDVGPDPTGKLIPLVQLHANLLQDVLERRPVRELPRWSQLLATLLAGLFLTTLALAARAQVASVALAVVLLGLLGATLLLAQRGLVGGPLAMALSATLSFLGALGGRLATQDRERALLREAFGAYVDPGVLARILDGESGLALGGARRVLTVLFSDIQGYTGLSNQLPPEEVIALLREYLEVMTTLVRKRGGRVDKIMGDGIMAVFGDPLPDPAHAASAVAAALDMQREMVTLAERWTREGKARLAIRVGVATGEVFVGNIGSRQAKIEYTVLGRTVNLASRLEGKAPTGGVLVSEATREACGERFAFERVEGLALKGYEGEVAAYVARAR